MFSYTVSCCRIIPWINIAPPNQPGKESITLLSTVCGNTSSSTPLYASNWPDVVFVWADPTGWTGWSSFKAAWCWEEEDREKIDILG